MDFKYDLQDKKDYTLVKLKGSLIEKHQADELIYDVENHLIQDKVKFVIDLAELEFVNQAGGEVLYKILTLARKNGGEATVFNISETLKKTAEGKKIEQVFFTCENEFLAAALL